MNYSGSSWRTSMVYDTGIRCFIPGTKACHWCMISVFDLLLWKRAQDLKSYAMLCREWTNENMLKRCKGCRCLDSSEWLSEQHCMPISDAIPLSLDSQVPFPAANTTPTCPSKILERENCENSVAAMFVQLASVQSIICLPPQLRLQ